MSGVEHPLICRYLRRPHLIRPSTRLLGLIIFIISRLALQIVLVFNICCIVIALPGPGEQGDAKGLDETGGGLLLIGWGLDQVVDLVGAQSR